MSGNGTRGEKLWWCMTCDERVKGKAEFLAHRMKDHDIFQVVQNPETGKLHMKNYKGTFCNRHAKLDWKSGCVERIEDPEEDIRGSLCKKCLHMSTGLGEVSKNVKGGSEDGRGD